MRVSVRLKGIWASALIASFAMVQAPASTYGQTQTAPAVQMPAAPTTVVGDANIDAAAKEVLLRARQALAQSDLNQAESLLNQAATMPANFDALGDSPATIQALVDRQNQLVGMAQGQHPDYNAGAASFFLVQAEALLYYQDFDAAETLLQHARSFNVQFNDKIGDPDRLQKLLEISRASLQKPAPAIAVSDDATMTVRKLISQSQLAFDQGQYNEAQALILDAKKLNVDETQFAADQMRTWQMELEIQKALGGTASLAAETKIDSQVAPTSYEMIDDENVTRAGYDPATDTTKNVQVASFTDTKQSTSASNFAPIPSNPMEYYRAGLKAIADQNPKEARNYLIRAWEGRQQLDDVTQQSLQDQLARLNVRNDATSQTATANLQGRGSKDIEAFRQLQAEVFRERVKADKLLAESPRAALEKMAMIRNRIGQSNLDADQQSPLLKMIDRDMEEVQKYIEENLADIDNVEQNDRNMEIVERRQQRRMDVERQLQGLVEDYNQLIDEQRFAEAELIAAQAMDLDPGSVISVLLFEKVKLQKRIVMDEMLEEAKRASFLDSLESVKRASIADVTPERSIILGDRETFLQNGQRRAQRLEQGRYSSEAEARIWNQLRNERVQGDYRGTLKDALGQLAQTAGVNIILDELALSESSIPTDSQVNIPIHSPISLKSALEIILSQKRLVFEVENEVIKVTTPSAQKTNLSFETYYIGDLVMQLDTPRDPMAMEWMSPNRSFGAMGSSGSMNVQNVATSAQAPSQLAMGQNFGGGLPGIGNSGYANGPQKGEPLYNKMANQQLGGVTLNDFQPLLDLIRSTIDSENWGDGETGSGTSSISPYAQNLSIVVSAPQETQDKVQNLLRKLRELNDVQIVVEVRFVTLQDDFFERVGIDFDFSIDDNTGGAGTNALGDNVLVNGGSGIVGVDPVNSTPFTPTSDFDLGFLQSNFTAAEPLFGGSIASAATFGFAILSDIEVFFLLQAGKSSTRTNITQAPTVTMFNGQSASVSDFAQRPFVTSVIPVVGDFAVAHQPIITLIPDGTNLNVQAVVTADRQFVKLRLVPYFTQVTEVSTFTFNGSQQIETTTNSVLDDLLNIVDGTIDNSDPELLTSTTGITIQLPVVAVTNVSTVVSVPDGGTVLMGGIKRMQEGRSEAGVPFLSNIPYVNRLFKNVGIGHETSHLMMMVTPRIIIQKEIEEDAVGGRSN